MYVCVCVCVCARARACVCVCVCEAPLPSLMIVQRFLKQVPFYTISPFKLNFTSFRLSESYRKSDREHLVNVT